MSPSSPNCHTKPRKMDQKKAAEWNPGLIISTKTQRRARRPAKRWEDNLNEFVKDGETEATQSHDLKNNNRWLTAAKNVYEWGNKERQHAKHVIDDSKMRPTSHQQHDITSNNITTPTAATPRHAKTQCSSHVSDVLQRRAPRFQ